MFRANVEANVEASDRTSLIAQICSATAQFVVQSDYIVRRYVGREVDGALSLEMPCQLDEHIVHQLTERNSFSEGGLA